MQNFKIKDGLPSEEVYCAFQDSKGFIWFGSDGGVSKFDGYAFKNYTTEDGLADNVVFGILEDKHGRIWFRSLSGKLCYLQDDSILQIEANEHISQMMKNGLMSSFYIDSGDTLWCGIRLGNGFFKIAPPYKTGNLQYIKTVKGVSLIDIDKKNFIMGSVFQDKTTYPFLSLYKKNRLLKTIHIPEMVATHFFSLRLAEDTFLITDLDKLFSVQKNQIVQVFNSNHFSANHSTFLKRAGSYLWWGLQGKGVLRCSENDRLLWKNATQLLSGYSVSDVMVDREGGTWYTTLENGVYYASPANFNSYRLKGKNPVYNKYNIEKINENYIIASNKPDEVDIISADTFIRNVKINDPRPVDILKQAVNPYTRINVGNGLDSSQAYVWIKKYKRLKKAAESRLPVNFICFFPRDISQKEHYIFNRTWVLSYSDSAEYTTKFSLIPARPFSYYQDKKGVIWIGCVNGLWSFEKGKFIYHGNENKLLKTTIEDIKEGTDGSYYYATRGNGIVIRKGNTYRKITTANGLSSNNCRCLYISNDSTIWAGAKNGLTKLTLHEAGWQGIKFNLTDNEYVYEIYKIEKTKNTLWLFTNRGLLSYRVDEDKKELPPPIYLTKFCVNETSYNKDSRLVFRYNENSIKITYVGLSFQSSGKMYYAYKLDGLDTAWHTTTSTSLQYPFLPPGEYRLYIKAISINGVESTYPVSVNFRINNPFWKTAWFIILTVLSVSGLLYLWFYLRLKEIKRREAEKTSFHKQLAELEMKALRSQMNPHFIFNAINSIQNYIVKNNSTVAQDYLAKFARLIRHVLENSKHENIALSDEIETLKIYVELEQLRAPGKFEFNLFIQESINPDYFVIPPLILQPYVENAILHGLMPLTDRKGILAIHIEKTDDRLRCIIEDNGIGRKKAAALKLQKRKLHRSMGLSVTEDRIKLANNEDRQETVIIDKVSERGEAEGTRIIILINILK